ncbi:MAG: PhoX family phosphatase [Sedimenticolaceae bacterium]
MSDEIYSVQEVDSGDEPMSNHSDNRHFSNVLERRLSRREVLTGSLGAAVAGLFGAGVAQARPKSLPPQAKGRPPFALNPSLGFDAIPVTRSDTATLPHGYRAQTLIPWGTPINGSAPLYDGVDGNSGEDQEQQVGSHHDGMHYFPMADDPNGHGLLCVNHEYVDQRVLHVNGPTNSPNGPRPDDEVRKEIAAHGVSVVEVKKTHGMWDLVDTGGYNRRITAGTEIELSGPVRGSDLVKTKFSPDGTMTRGTINNCANGYTPWGTYLTCEENWAGYFVNKVQLTRIDALFDALGFMGTSAPQGDYYARYDSTQNKIIGVIDETVDQKVTSNVYTQAGGALTDGRELLGVLDDLLASNGIDIEVPREQSRYGVRTTSSRYGWETAESGSDEYIRFNASILSDDPTQDYHYEPNTMGWIVEIDPFDPESTPKKRTAMGRFAHEGCIFAPPQQGQPLAFYMGDDARFEYIYKFVTKARYFKGMQGDILDDGTLYVARFNEDGTGDWLPLDIDDLGFQAAAAAAGVEFKDQADVLVNTRLAADVFGATKMDRPEWGTAHPQTREVYMTLTNNTRRTVDQIDAPNPRPENATGHIIRWREKGNRAFATKFEWDIFVLAGPQDDSQVLPAEGGPALDGDNIFAAPDGVWIDNNGILWIQTDMSGSLQGEGPYGENGMLASNPITGEIKRFLSGPFNQETTGVVSTPDGKNLFVNFQHPGDRSTVGNFTSNWPEGGPIFGHPGDPVVEPLPDGPRPRSSTIVITREDGGVVGLGAEPDAPSRSPRQGRGPGAR